MARTSAAFEERIRELLSDSANVDHPLHEALDLLWEAHQDLARRIDRISYISDAYQSMAREREMGLTERLEKQLRQLEKVARISDRYQQMMRDLNTALQEASTHDVLTGLGNRRLLIDRLKSETERSKRYDRPFSIVMLDIDHFKHVNDAHGHEVGDRVLVEVARVMDEQIREHDLCGRWGGEEFLIVLPETTLATTKPVVERLRDGIRDLRVRVDTQLLSVTVSVGVAEHRPAEGYSATINRADMALLQAKRNGRDRCEIAQD